MSFIIITWISLGLIGGAIFLFYEWYTGQDISLKAFVSGLIQFLSFGPLGLIFTLILVVDEVLEKFKNVPFIKGRKQ